MRLDPVLVEVLNNRFSAIVNEMGYIIWRTAFTAYVKETWDFTPGLVTRDGEIFAFSKDIGGAPFLGLPLRDFLAGIHFQPGDVVITNDPYSTGGMCTHLPDLHLVKPFFHDGELVCFIWDFIHAADVGGIVPGNAPPSTYDIFQEGVRVPPSRLFKGGRLDEEVQRFLLANTRVPDHTWGDVKALLAALNSAERRLTELAQRYGIDTLKAGIADVLDYAEKRARDIISAVPDGVYPFVDYIEGFPTSQMPNRIALGLEIRGSDIVMDFTGTDLQMTSSYNIPTDGKTHHFLTFGLVSYIRSVDPACPLNAGMVRPIRVRVPRGTFLNPEPYASCSVRYVTAERVMDVAMGALAQAGVPLIPAAGGGCVAPILFSVLDPHTGRYKMGILQMLLGGMGGRPGRDGVDGADFGNAFFRNGPNEMAEAEMPVLVRRYAWDTGRIPSGQWRGGLGVAYEVEILAPQGVMTARCMERERFRPWGRDGGSAGTPISSVLNPGTTRERTLGKIDVLHLGPGDVVRITMPSGGGFGDPRARDPEHVRRDVEEELLTPEAAERDYSVVLRNGRVDEAATRARRARRTPDGGRFTFGEERDRYERVYPQELQHKVIADLLQYPAAIRVRLREQLWKEVVDPALQAGTPLDEAATVARLRELADSLARPQVGVRGAATVAASTETLGPGGPGVISPVPDRDGGLIMSHRPPFVGNLHCDIHLEITKLREEKNERAVLERAYLPKLEKGRVDFEFYTVGGDHRHFTRSDDLTLGTLRMIEHAWDETVESPHFTIATSARQIRDAKAAGKKALILAIEGAAPIREDLSLLHTFYRLGLRSVCLTWFKANPTADGINEKRQGGLTNFGRALIEEMNRLGMVIDVSQATDTTVADVLELSTQPIVASHSAVRAVHPHPRNLTNDQLRALAAKGGLLGLTTFPAHLGGDRPTSEQFFDHLDYVVNLVGHDHVCLGLNIIVHDLEIATRFFDRSKIDYTSMWLSGLEDVDRVPAVIEGLIARGYKETDVDKILGGNLLRLVEQVIG